MMLLGPRWNLEHHHLCSAGRDSVGLSGWEVAKVTDVVLDASSVFRVTEDLNDDDDDDMVGLARQFETKNTTRNKK